MKKTESLCVDCGLPCQHCGNVTFYECDNCGATDMDGRTRMFEVEGKHYCFACLMREFSNDFYDDMMEEHGLEWARDNFPEVVSES